MVTVADAIKLLEVCNPHAVLCLCVDGFPYANVSSIRDCTNPGLLPGDDIGNALVVLDAESDVAQFLYDCGGDEEDD